MKEMVEKVRNWGKWGPDDELGTLNYITPSKIARAARLVTRGQVFALGIPLQRNGPQNCGSLIPHERVMNSLHLLCDKVCRISTSGNRSPEAPSLRGQLLPQRADRRRSLIGARSQQLPSPSTGKAGWRRGFPRWKIGALR